MFPADDLVEPDFAAARAAREAVGDDLAAVFRRAPGNRVRLHAGAFVLGCPVMHGHRYGDVGAPAAFIVEVTLPRRRAVGRAVYFEQGHGVRGIVGLVKPFEHQPRYGCHSREQAGALRRELVTHLPAVRHARAEYVAAAQPVSFLQVAHQLCDELHVVDGHVRLERVACVPACLAPAVLRALRVADGKAVAVGRGVQPEAARVVVTAVTVQDDHQRGALGQPLGQVELVAAFDAARAHRVGRGVRICGLGPGDGCRQQEECRKKTLYDGGVRKVFHAVGIFGAQSPFRAMRQARLL